MMKKVLKYISNNWLGLIGTIFGIIGVTLSIYFYKLSVLERVPAMLVNPSRIHIISSERTMKVPIEIHSKSGKVIEDDISLIKIYLWNAGKLSIKKENILKNIQITIGEEKNEILDHQIINQTRDIIEGALFTDKNSPKNAINVSFNILEYNDGLTIQLIYIGKPDSIVKISGIFEGANGFLQEDELLNKQFWPEFMYTILSILIFGLFLILFAKIDKWIETNSLDSHVNFLT